MYWTNNAYRMPAQTPRRSLIAGQIFTDHLAGRQLRPLSTSSLGVALPFSSLPGAGGRLPVVPTSDWLNRTLKSALTLILLPVSRFFRLDIQNNLWKLVSAWGWGWFFFSGHFGHQVTTATQWPLTIRNYSYWLLTICPIEFNASKAIDPTLTKREHLTYLTNCEAYSPRPKKEDTRIWLLTFRPDRIYN